MDKETKQLLKQPDQFVKVTEQGLGWAKSNRQTALMTGVAAVVLILLLVGGYTLYQHRSQSASTAFGNAMETYQTPLLKAGEPPPPGTKTFDTLQQRASTANGQFADVASRYSMTQSGKLAEYFVGLTYMEEGQNDAAEKALKKTADSWNSDLSALGKLALSQLYAQTGRADQAHALLEELGKSKEVTVPAGEAQLQLADLYNAEGNTAKAHEIYAKLKDNDKDKQGNPGPAGSIAAEKLNPKPAGGLGGR